jgi:glycosyltransferase involved in cell wall biosynthesis
MVSIDDAFVSIIIPCRKEKGHISTCLETIVSNDFPKDRMEVLVIDGMSDDGTREEVRAIAERYPFIQLLDNPQQITPCALNIGIRRARGDIIVRMDAHASYPKDYLGKLLYWMENTGADNVGGVLVARPGGDGPVARAIAVAILSPFGVGNAYFRIGSETPRWVDTVPFGCYRRTVFQQIGLFDEDLIRNQDDELNSRLAKAGGKILLSPDIQIDYFARTKISQLWRMYFQYGYYKPLVIRKVGTVVTARQLVPAAFVLALVLGAATAPLHAFGLAALSTVIGAYALVNLSASLLAAIRERDPSLLLVLPVAFAVVHLAYGSGFLKGIWNFLVKGHARAVNYSNVPLSR